MECTRGHYAFNTSRTRIHFTKNCFTHRRYWTTMLPPG